MPLNLYGILTTISDTGVTQKASAAKSGDVSNMMWVDQECYFGPDRRLKLAGLRLRERRRDNLAGQPPSLSVALRQLRMRVLDARGPGAARFADRVQTTALLAQIQHEFDASDALGSLAITAQRGVERDVRPSLYEGLDRVHASLTMH